MNKVLFSSLFCAATIAASTTFASAATLTCPTTVSATNPQRQMTFSSAVAGGCYTGSNENPNAATVAAAFGGTAADWSAEGHLNGNGVDDLLTVNLTAGAWGVGGQSVTGTWSINPLFWTIYGRAVISFHVGEGNGDPDFWLFDVTPQSQNGTFSYVRRDGGGGGLSNAGLWGQDGTQPPCTSVEECPEPRDVPEPTSLALLGLGLIGAGFVRRRK